VSPGAPPARARGSRSSSALPPCGSLGRPAATPRRWRLESSAFLFFRLGDAVHGGEGAARRPSSWGRARRTLHSAAGLLNRLPRRHQQVSGCSPLREVKERRPLLCRPRRRRPASSRSSSGPPLLPPSAAVLLISPASGFARGRCSGRWWSPEQGVAHALDVRCIWRIRAPCGTSRSPYRAPVRE
jgi:hypothetical protein